MRRRRSRTGKADVSGLRWTLVVPLKPPQEGKSRLSWWLAPGPRMSLVRAMTADTVAAAAAAERVDRIVVVTSDADTVRRVREAAVGAAVDVVHEPQPPDLNRAVRAGIDHARSLDPTHGVGVLLGDLPALHATDVDEALAAAAAHPLGVVTDATGAGTTLLTALPGVSVHPAFGAGSAQAHLDRGHVRIALAPGSGLGHDVDVPDDLPAVIALGVGDRTRRVLRVVGSLARPRRTDRPGPLGR